MESQSIRQQLSIGMESRPTCRQLSIGMEAGLPASPPASSSTGGCGAGRSKAVSEIDDSLELSFYQLRGEFHAVIPVDGFNAGVGS